MAHISEKALGHKERVISFLKSIINVYTLGNPSQSLFTILSVPQLAAMQHMAAIQATATATSVLSTKRNVTYHVSPPRSPDEGGGGRKNSAPRKHVQFISAHPNNMKDEEKLHAHWSVAGEMKTIWLT